MKKEIDIAALAVYVSRMDKFQSVSKEYDRQIKECRRAAFYALTLEEKLIAISRASVLLEQKKEFRKNNSGQNSNPEIE